MKTHGENTIELLNSRIDKFYNYELDFIDNRKIIEFKAMLITFMNQLERVFVGVYGKAFMLDYEDFELFKEMNPYIYEVVTSDIGDVGIIKLSLILHSFRNLNAHAFVNKDYQKDFDAKFILEKLPNYSDTVKYYDEDGTPTLAGMITILLFLSNDKAIKYFISNDIWNGFIEQLNYFGEDYVPCVYDFPENVVKVSKFNDESIIRKPSKSKDILEAIFGRFLNKISQEDDLYIYTSGEDEEDSKYHVTFSIKQKNDEYVLIVKKRSNYGEYFSKDYKLTIKDVDGFMRWCEKVPPFMFVAYLYKGSVEVYTKDAISGDAAKLIEKLNRPKFYVDKNINTLYLTEDTSDVRMGGQIISVGVNYCLYMFEMVSFKRNELQYNIYSNLKDALSFVRISEPTIDKLVALRNFFSHQYILGDDHVVGKGFASIDLEFVTNAFYEFTQELIESDPYKAHNVSNDFYYRVICNLLLFKYADGIKKSRRFMANPSDETFNSIRKTMLRINHSFVRSEHENLFINCFGKRDISIYNQTSKMLERCILKSNEPIRFKNGFVTKGPIELINIGPIRLQGFLEDDNFVIESNFQDGWLKTITWTNE